jgi:hypothetical protein
VNTSSRSPIRNTITSDATNPPTLTIPVADPRRAAGANVRATSNPIIDPGPPRPVATISTTSIQTGASPGQSSTTVQQAMIAPTMDSTSVERW